MADQKLVKEIQEGAGDCGYFPHADLDGADLEGADLRHCVLWWASLKGANLKGANLHNAKLNGANLEGADLRGANLSEANFSKQDKADGANLRDADLSDANVENAYFEGAILHGAKGFSMAEILDGKAHSEHLLEELSSITQKLSADGIVPKLHVLLVGDDPASQTYVRSKAKRAERVGIRSEVTRLPDSTTADEVLALIAKLNEDPDTDGILVQLPLPDLPTRTILDSVAPEKDVDGFHPINAGLLAQRRPSLVSCTPIGIISLLDAHDIQMEGANALVVGRSDIVGRPMATLLTHRNATVTVAHSRTQNLEEFVGRADILVVAMGKMHAIPASWVKPGAVVVDVGIHRTNAGPLTGDVDFYGIETRASAYTPVPGGVGPMTIAMLLVNTTLAALTRRGRDLDVARHLVPVI